MNEYKLLKRLQNNLKKRSGITYNVGAFIVDKSGFVISEGYNSYVKTHPRMLENPLYNDHQIFVHAECDAIYKLPRDSKPFAMIVCRINKQGKIMLSKPCAGCYHEILTNNIRKVYYISVDGTLTILKKVNEECY